MVTSLADLHTEPDVYNTRIILDTATLRFDRGSGNGRWIVASVSPKPGTGEKQILNGVFYEGKIVDRQTLQPVTPEIGYHEVGSWVLVAALEGENLPERGTYEWDEPAGSPFHLTRIDVYDVFSDGRSHPGSGGGIIVTRYDAAGEGRKPFHEVNLIPPAWHETVKSTFDTFRSDEPPFARTTSRDEALSLLGSESPLTAVAAFRRLASDLAVNPHDLQHGILLAKGYLRAVFTYLAVHHTAGPEMAEQVLRDVIGRIDTVAGLTPLVVGVATASLYADERSPLQDLWNRVREIARARVETIRDGAEIHPRLKRMLRLD
jgi:hypothetical protein